jgi:hypothetical protein
LDAVVGWAEVEGIAEACAADAFEQDEVEETAGGIVGEGPFELDALGEAGMSSVVV